MVQLDAFAAIPDGPCPECGHRGRVYVVSTSETWWEREGGLFVWAGGGDHRRLECQKCSRTIVDRGDSWDAPPIPRSRLLMS